MNTDLNEKHICFYCGNEAHYQFKNGKWCCAKTRMGCPHERKRISENVTNIHKYFKDLGYTLTEHPDSAKRPKTKKPGILIKYHGEHICVYCGNHAEYQLKNGNWCCETSPNKCPVVKKHNSDRLKDKYQNDEEYKANRKDLYKNLPEETKKRMAWAKGKTKFTDERVRKRGELYHQKCISGEIIPSFKGKHHDPETIEKIRMSTVKYFEEVKRTGGAKFSKKACEFIDNLNKEKGWNLQHGMNGGEYIVGGYYLDGYDKELNIAFEYDEKPHYVDLENNVLRERDMKRMKYIHEKLNCRFFRYNETTKKLYEVMNF